MKLPRLCFVGPMLGRTPGHVPSQGERLSDLFQELGYSVISVSSLTNRYARLADITNTLVRERTKIDILIVLTYSGPSFFVQDVASWIGRRANLPLIMSLHGGAIPQFMNRFPSWTTRVLRRADILVSQSDYLARSITSYGFKARVIPNVIKFPKYPYRLRTTVKPRLFWMRSFHPLYNPEMAIQVLARVRTQLPEATLVMAGQDNGMQSEMQRLAERLGLNDAIRFPGFLDMEDKVREAEAADIFINTPHVDNRPVCVVEACAMGLPVISTSVGGVPDLLIHEKTGLLVPDGDIDAMAQAVFRLVETKELSSKLSEAGRQLAENSSQSNVAPKWEEIFSELIARYDNPK